MKALISILILTHGLIAVSQSMIPVDQDTSVGVIGHEFYISSMADYQSTSVGKDITRSFIYGGFITQEMKESSSSRHDEINRFGIDINADFEYRNHKVNLFKDSLSGFIIKAGMYNFSSAMYSKDLFDLTFFGNQMFIGDTANLSGSEFNSMTFQKIGFGWLDKKSKSSVCFNLIGLNSYINGSFGDTYLFQSQAIDSMSLELDGTSKRAIGESYFKGIGAAFDIDYRFKMKKTEKEHIYFQLMVRNLGFAYVPKTETYNANGIVSYSNYEISELINSETIFNNTEETINDIADTLTNKSAVILLPAMFQFTKLIDRSSSNLFQGFFGFRGYLNKAYIPMLFGGLDYRPKKWCSLGIQASYGGFSQLRWGMYSSFTFPHFTLGIASENLFNKRGESITLKLSCVL